MGDDLPVHLDRASGTPLWRQVADQVRQAALDGVLVAGQRLPSTRGLAARLRVSRAVVAAAYDQLFAEGVVAGRHGSGTYVAELAPRHRPDAGGRGPAPAPGRPRLEEPFALGTSPLRGPGEAAWRRALVAASRHGPLATGDPRGTPGARAAVADHLRRSRGIVCAPDEVLLTPGSTHALRLLAATALHGGAVGVEDPGYRRGRLVLAAAGAQPVSLPVDADGLLPARVPGALAAVVCTPSHQFPLGGRLSVARRQALLRRAAASGALVVEDDYDSEFRYGTSPLPALAALQRRGVVYLGTTSQVLGPGGSGWLVAEAALVAELAAHQEASGGGVPPVLADALRRYLLAGEWDREVRRARREYGRRRAALTGALTAAGLRVLGDPAGLHLVVELPDGVPAGEAAARCARDGLAVGTVAEYAHVLTPPEGLVLGFGRAPADVLARAGARVVRAVTGRAIPA